MYKDDITQCQRFQAQEFLRCQSYSIHPVLRVLERQTIHRIKYLFIFVLHLPNPLLNPPGPKPPPNPLPNPSPPLSNPGLVLEPNRFELRLVSPVPTLEVVMPACGDGEGDGAPRVTFADIASKIITATMRPFACIQQVRRCIFL